MRPRLEHAMHEHRIEHRRDAAEPVVEMDEGALAFHERRQDAVQVLDDAFAECSRT